jgi:glutamate synthase (NADPH/NADH) large chain
MVDLDPMEEEDFQCVRELLQNHLDYTSSATAEALLSDWSRRRSQFTKVMPRDFKRVLEQRKQAEALVAEEA